MPYSNTRALPIRVKHGRSENQRRAFVHAFNSATEEGLDEESRWKISYSAAKKAGKFKKKTKAKISKSFRTYCEENL